MKIKNISNNDLVLSIQIGENGGLIMNVKPNQVMYCEEKSNINKQLIIYEKKKLITITKDIEKPEYVGYYKPYFESGTYQTISKKTNNTIIVEVDDEEDDDITINVSSAEINLEAIQDADEETKSIEGGSPKRGRGRPKKPIEHIVVPQEKKKRGRPKGSTKKTQ